MGRTRKALGPYTVVIKLGTSSIIHETTHQPLLSTLSAVVETCVKLRAEGHKVVLVSSGAIGVGMRRMELPAKPKSLSGRQALAAIGQGRLIALWDNLFSQLGQPIAQVLLTRGDISDRSRYLNAVNTFTELLGMGVVPIVNENDTVSVSEIRFGDNDTLSAITASMVHADYLFLLTDVEALYTSNPRKDPDAKSIDVVHSVAEVRKTVSTATLGSKLGTGGMETKLIAAEIATAAGVATIITSSKNPTNVFSIIEYNSNIQKQLLPDSINASTLSPSQSSSASASGVTTPSSALTSISMSSEDTVTSFSAPQGLSIPVPPSSSSSSQISEATTPLALVRPPHTLFQPSPKPLRDAKSWTAYTLAPAGTVIIDAGAHRVLAKRDSGGRLLAVGVLSVVGTFAPGQAVRIVVRKRTEKAEKAADAAVAHIHKEIKGLKTRARQSTSDSGTGSPATPATPSLLPMSLSTISVSSLEPFSRSGSDASMTDLNAVGGQDRHLDSTPLAGKIALPSENNNDQEDAKKDRDPTAVIPVPLTEDDKKPKETTIQYSAAVEEGWIEVEVGRGLANYNSVEISKIKGMKSANIVQVLGYVDSEYVVENITIHLVP